MADAFSHSIWLTHYQPAFKPGTRLETKNHIKPQFPDALIDRILPMLPLNFREYELGRIAVVKATEVGLYFKQLFGAVECHVLGVRGRDSGIRERACKARILT